MNKPIKATVQYLKEGLPRQKQFEAASEEKLLENVFWFQAEHYPAVKVQHVCYHGKVIDWETRSTYAHFRIGEGRMSFEEFKKACLNEPQIVRP